MMGRRNGEVKDLGFTARGAVLPPLDAAPIIKAMRGRAGLFAVLFAVGAFAQEDDADRRVFETPPGMVDEDEEVLTETQYVFNPIQARKDVKVGDFYAKKGNYRAAAGRYSEAVKWDPNFAEAYLKLAEARDKLDQPAEALKAYRAYLRLDPDGKKARKAEERLAELEKEAALPPAAAEDAENASNRASESDPRPESRP